jgi:hypothetical protein
VMLDVDGEILNILHTGYLNIKAISPEQTQRKENDQARLMKVLLDYKPHFIVLGAAKVQCRYLSQDISDVSNNACFHDKPFLTICKSLIIQCDIGRIWLLFIIRT